MVSAELRKEGDMLIRTWRFMTIILTALTMGMAFCHLLQPSDASHGQGLTMP